MRNIKNGIVMVSSIEYRDNIRIVFLIPISDTLQKFYLYLNIIIKNKCVESNKTKLKMFITYCEC